MNRIQVEREKIYLFRVHDTFRSIIFISLTTSRPHFIMQNKRAYWLNRFLLKFQTGKTLFFKISDSMNFLAIPN